MINLSIDSRTCQKYRSCCQQGKGLIIPQSFQKKCFGEYNAFTSTMLYLKVLHNINSQNSQINFSEAVIMPYKYMNSALKKTTYFHSALGNFLSYTVRATILQNTCKKFFLILLFVYFQGKVKSHHCSWSIQLFQVFVLMQFRHFTF